MSQYQDGAISINNGSATVTGFNTLFLANVAAGNLLRVNDGSIPIAYEVLSIGDDTTLTLSAPYAGPTVALIPYTISKDFTSIFELPLVSRGDRQTGALFRQAMNQTDAVLLGGAKNIVPISNHTANYNILASEISTLFTTVGTTSAFTFSLPPAAPGLFYMFSVFQNSNNTIRVDISAGDEIINQSGVGGFTRTQENSTGGFLDIVAIDNTSWVIRVENRTWFYDTP